MLLVEFRKYQDDMLAAFEKLRASGERKFHFIAPPGSGKTLIGLELMHRLGAKAAVFSPTNAIQGQWVDVCRTYSNSFSASTDPYSDAGLVSLTYQLISVKGSDGRSLHKNVQALMASLESRTTIILDECHHLTDEWARVLSKLDTSGRVIIGLTATPPIDREEKALETYAKLLGPVTYEIPVPPVVKEGYLAPFQDLVYLCSPTDDEAVLIDRLCASYRDLMRRMLETDELTPIHFWAASRLEEYRDGKGTVVPFDELLRSNFAFCVAAARFVTAKGGRLPPSVFFVPEMDEALRFDDALLVLEDYAQNCLMPLARGSGSLTAPPAAKAASSRFLEDLPPALRDLGYAMDEEGIRAQGQGVRAILGKSRGKILALKPIILGEMASLGDDFSCLILTDYEDGADRDGTGALDVMRFLTSDPELDECDPILLTGRTVLVDDDLWEDFSVAAEVFFERGGFQVVLKRERVEGFYEASSDSPDWSTRAYVPLITHLLERGLTRCVVSTKSMLGEGWNAVRLNTLIDLTVASGYAFVNQMRGRTLRLDPERPLKVANNWDVAALLEDSEQGSYDLDRLRRKYSRFFGMGEDGTVERGIGHLHPDLDDQTNAFLFANRDALNALMLARAGSRSKIRASWRVGGRYRDATVCCVDIVPIETAGPVLEVCPREAQRVYRFCLGLLRPLRALLLAFSFIGLVAGRELSRAIGFPAAVPIGIIVVAAVLFWFPRASGVPGMLLSPIASVLLSGLGGRKKLYSRLCRVVLVAAGVGSDGSKAAFSVVRRDGAWRVFAKDESVSRLLTSALSDMLSPPSQRKYVLRAASLLSRDELLRRGLGFSKLPAVVRGPRKGRWKRFLKQADKLDLAEDGQTMLVPVPEAFSGKKEDAERFLAAWESEISAAQLVGARGKDYAALVLPRAGEKPLPLRYVLRELWE